jgi:hypothetical protein
MSQCTPRTTIIFLKGKRKRLKLGPCLSPCTNINSKWIKNLNINHEILKLLQEKNKKTLEHIGIGNNDQNRTPVAKN